MFNAQKWRYVWFLLLWTYNQARQQGWLWIIRNFLLVYWKYSMFSSWYIFFSAWLWRRRKAPYTEIWVPLHHMLSLFLYNDKKGLHSVPDNVMAPEISVACRRKEKKAFMIWMRIWNGFLKKGLRSTFTLNSEITWKMSRCRVWRIATFHQALF